MQPSRLVTGLAGVFGVLTSVLVLLGLVYNPAILMPATLFAIVTYLFYQHGSGTLFGRLYSRVEARAATDGPQARGRGGFGAGPREEWTPPRDSAAAGRRQRHRRHRNRRAQQEARRARQRRRQRYRQARTNGGPADTGGPTRAEACRILGVDADADADSVKRAYRRKVKEVHPDTDGGDEEAFKRVNEAYETLTE